MASAYRLAEILAASKLLPRALSNNPEGVFTVIAAGRELGLTAMQSIRSIHVFDGKPILSADLMLALCLRSAVCERFQLIESTDKVATYEAKRAGQEPVRMSWTIEQAKVAKLTSKDNWQCHPAAMLRARCIAATARAVFPDLMLGVYETDEIAPATQARIPQPARVQVETFDATEEPAGPSPIDSALASFEAATSLEELSKARADFAALKLRTDDATKATLRAAYDAANARLTSSTTEAA